MRPVFLAAVAGAGDGNSGKFRPDKKVLGTKGRSRNRQSTSHARGAESPPFLFDRGASGAARPWAPRAPGSLRAGEATLRSPARAFPFAGSPGRGGAGVVLRGRVSALPP